MNLARFIFTMNGRNGYNVEMFFAMVSYFLNTRVALI